MQTLLFIGKSPYITSCNQRFSDVKPENLLIYTDEANLLRLKLADFGLATKVNEGELLYHICGTPTYVAPEVLAEYGSVIRTGARSIMLQKSNATIF